MNFKTKHKDLEENLFADMIVLVGTFMVYGNMYSTFSKDDIMKYYNELKDNIRGRCKIQNNVIRQAKKYYEKEGNPKHITYSKVKRIFRRNTFCKYRIRSEQYYFWEFVMDYIINNPMLLDIVFQEVMLECKFYSNDEKKEIPYVDCMQRILGWYYVRIATNNRVYSFKKDLRKKMINMFYSYEHFPEFKKNCRSYMSSI